MGSRVSGEHRLTRAEAVLAALATAAALALTPIVLWLPVYTGESASVDANGTITSRTTGSMSLADMNGRWVLVYAAAILVIVLTVVIVIALRPRGSGPGALAWTLFGILAAFTLLSAMSLGIFVLPAAGLLLALCVVRQAAATPS